MPYIKPEEREFYDNLIENIIDQIFCFGITEFDRNDWKGHLNYIISKLCHRIIKIRELRYHTCNDVMGVLECVKQELYRTVIATYEDEKRSENGSVSKLDSVEDE